LGAGEGRLSVEKAWIKLSAEPPETGQRAQDAPLDPTVTPELFREWRSPRFGRSNPERMNNPVWEWLIRSKLNAYQANQRLDGPSASDAGPGWCFDRFGQSSTRLQDGRNVLIAGEHEDFYDSDFYIYNDVVVRHTDGVIDIFGYPRDIFSPTDFHSATLAGNRIIIIGSLGYPEERQAGTTPVAVLDLRTFTISKVVTAGNPPGWLHLHTAVLSEDGASICIRQGLLDRRDGDGSLVENIDDWRLSLTDWSWQRLTDRRWQRWEVRRNDRRTNHLWEIRMALFSRQVHWEIELQRQVELLTRALGAAPDLDLAHKLYHPDLPHQATPKGPDEHNVFRICIDGVVVRYVETGHSIQMTVEGDLPQASVQALVSDLVTKLSSLEKAPYEAKLL
jgi:hypothetical protein